VSSPKVLSRSWFSSSLVDLRDQMASLANGGFPLRLGLHLLNTEERGTFEWAGLGPSGLSFGSIFSTVHLLHFGSLAPWIVGFGRRYLCDQVEGSLCMNFQSFHLGPREFSIQAHRSLPPLEASSHMVRAPWFSCKTFSKLDASFLI
jgi:hypothetical protein